MSLRLDADVIAWLKKDGVGCQTRANKMLRERMLQEFGGFAPSANTHSPRETKARSMGTQCKDHLPPRVQAVNRRCWSFNVAV